MAKHLAPLVGSLPDQIQPFSKGRTRVKSAAPETFCAFRFISGTTTRSPRVGQIRANGGSNYSRNVGRSAVYRTGARFDPGDGQGTG